MHNELGTTRYLSPLFSRRSEKAITNKLIFTYVFNNKLNTTDAQFGGAYIYDPTSSIFKLRDHNVVNDSGDDYIAYAFTEKQGFSKAGSFEGLSSTDGPCIYTGFTPSMILYKNADYLENWHIQSWKQESLNPNNNQFYCLFHLYFP